MSKVVINRRAYLDITSDTDINDKEFTIYLTTHYGETRLNIHPLMKEGVVVNINNPDYDDDGWMIPKRFHKKLKDAMNSRLRQVKMDGKTFDLNEILPLMDKKIVKELKENIASHECQYFLEQYLSAHYDKYGEEFMPS